MTAVGMVGAAPVALIQPINTERTKYERMWTHEQYRAVSPGEQWAHLFLSQARPERDAEAIDFGCGTGRGALMLALFGSMRVHMVDFAPNCLDPEVAQACETQPTRLSFGVADLTLGVDRNATYGYCCDVMEHIPPQDVRVVLRNILASANHVFFGISTVPDQLGALIGEQLHLTVQPMAWWVRELTALGAVVHWTRELDGACAIYCSAWRDAEEIVRVGRINTDGETVDAQVKENIAGGWMHATPHDRQDREVVLLAGGPSMRAEIDRIRTLRAGGAALVTVNGAYGWAIEQGLDPSAQVVLDAREFNARFTKPVLPQCKYLMASQVHPSTLEGLPRERTYLWHSGISDEAADMVTERVGFPIGVPGGSTVVLRAIPLLRMLGFARLHIFGFDSCVAEDAHHAYAQAENDGEPLMPVTCGGRTFTCTPWQVSQASEFRDLVKLMGDEIELAVYGDGLIAHIVQTGADLARQAAKTQAE
jgi:SAM-dependent methyltransferase